MCVWKSWSGEWVRYSWSSAYLFPGCPIFMEDEERGKDGQTFLSCRRLWGVEKLIPNVALAPLPVHKRWRGFRVSWGGGGELGFPQPQFPPEILKLSMIIMVLSQVLNNNLVPDCVRSNLRGSKFKISWGSMPPEAHTLTHAWVKVHHPATTMFSPPPNSKSCMKPWGWEQI